MAHWADSVEIIEWGARDQPPGHFAWGRWRSVEAAKKRLKADDRMSPLGINYLRIVKFSDGTAAILVVSDTDEDEDEWDEDEMPIMETRRLPRKRK